MKFSKGATTSLVRANAPDTVNLDSFDAPIFLKVRDVVDIGGRLFYLRKITNKDFVFRPLRKDQAGQIERVDLDA